MRLLTLFLALIFLSPLKADYDVGLAAYQRGDFETAYQEWLRVAESAADAVPPSLMAETCYALGMLFWVGQGVGQDAATSAQWLIRAAESGHPGAQTKLGYLYGSGQGVRQSDFAALKWTQMAANQGDVVAQYNLGVFYRDGQGVAQNSELALKWFREAASNGDQISASVITNYEKYGWPTSDKMAPESNDPASLPAVDGMNPVTHSGDKLKELTVVPGDHETTGLDSQFQPAADSSSDTGSQPSGTGKINDELWIGDRNPQHFTIQVIALLSPVKLQEFIENNSEWGPFAIYQQRWQGKPLFVLLQGDYSDVEQARAAVASFPVGLQKREELWIRKFSMVQGLLQGE